MKRLFRYFFSFVTLIVRMMFCFGHVDFLWFDGNAFAM